MIARGVKRASKGNHESIIGEYCRHIGASTGNHEGIKGESCRHISSIKGESKPRVGVSKENTNEYTRGINDKYLGDHRGIDGESPYAPLIPHGEY